MTSARCGRSQPVHFGAPPQTAQEDDACRLDSWRGRRPAAIPTRSRCARSVGKRVATGQRPHRGAGESAAPAPGPAQALPAGRRIPPRRRGPAPAGTAPPVPPPSVAAAPPDAAANSRLRARATLSIQRRPRATGAPRRLGSTPPSAPLERPGAPRRSPPSPPPLPSRPLPPLRPNRADRHPRGIGFADGRSSNSTLRSRPIAPANTPKRKSNSKPSSPPTARIASRPTRSSTSARPTSSARGRAKPRNNISSCRPITASRRARPRACCGSASRSRCSAATIRLARPSPKSANAIRPRAGDQEVGGTRDAEGSLLNRGGARRGRRPGQTIEARFAQVADSNAPLLAVSGGRIRPRCCDGARGRGGAATARGSRRRPSITDYAQKAPRKRARSGNCAAGSASAIVFSSGAATSRRAAFRSARARRATRCSGVRAGDRRGFSSSPPIISTIRRRRRCFA